MNQLWRKMHYVSTVLCLAVLVLQGVTAHAQVYEKTVIHSGDSISHHYSYLYPSFQNAMVRFRDGRSFVYKMDFNLMLCDMQYINKTGDTLVITNGQDIDSIQMDSCSFVYDYQKGYFQIVASADAGRLAVYRRTNFEPVQKGGFGEDRQSGGVEEINAIGSRQGAIPLVLNQDMNAVRTTIYLLIYKSGEMEKAGKSAYLKIYDGDKKAFEQYVKANKIKYNDLGDLEKLFEFCTQAKQ